MSDIFLSSERPRASYTLLYFYGIQMVEYHSDTSD